MRYTLTVLSLMFVQPATAETPAEVATRYGLAGELLVAVPKRIVERDGEIYGVQTRNFILPDDDRVIIVLTNRSADGFAMGEAWADKGFVYNNLLSAAACAGAA